MYVKGLGVRMMMKMMTRIGKRGGKRGDEENEREGRRETFWKMWFQMRSMASKFSIMPWEMGETNCSTRSRFWRASSPMH